MSSEPQSFLYGGNAEFLEPLYDAYLKDRNAVSAAWRACFDAITGPALDIAPAAPAMTPDDVPLRAESSGADAESVSRYARRQVAVLQLINAYRFRGHRQADLDPLRQFERPEVQELDPAFHGLDAADMDMVFSTGSLCGPDEAPLREIIAILRNTYCGTIGAEYMHINETSQKRWIQRALEPQSAAPLLSPEQRRNLLERLTAANALEEYLHTRYVGQKRFSLEGGESLIPLLDETIMLSGARGVREVVVGMAHRGRLNVLINIVGKKPTELFNEFEGKGAGAGSGDVKYHLGYSSDIVTPGGPVHVTLAFNPSHLEIIDPVVEGSVRARQDRRRDVSRSEVLPVLIHGDAAFAGQGVVMETFQLSQTRGYSTGGTIHVVVNNQIGFTTSDPLDSRSTLYCTDVAKMVQAPIFHVNADDPEAVIRIARLALDFRAEYRKDVVIDLVCFRRHGHSEADEPSVTQPLMYRRIRSHPGIRRLYGERLVREGVIGADEPDRLRQEYVASLERNEAVSRPLVCAVRNDYLINFAPYIGTSWTAPGDTRLPLDQLQSLAQRCTALPADFRLHKSVERLLESRRQMSLGQQPLDWGFAETLACASLLDAGHAVRISGQDSARGTFFHRHAAFTDQERGNTHLPLQHLSAGQAPFLVINSTLSEEAVLAFEFGYSSAEPRSLVVWEAQFGDFANGAQVVIDQFISSCEAKWGRHCGLVLLLPHGYEGQGPEHSSARLERFLQLCAEENMQVCVPSTPAQLFHLLRRQIVRPYRRPLVVMSPKSLLRHKLSVSTLEDITERGYSTVIDEIDRLDAHAVTRLLVCSGKVYYDLLEARRSHGLRHVAITRVEQLYPFPRDAVRAIVERYPQLEDVVWVQEEPQNQGAWFYLVSRSHLPGCLQQRHRLSVVARPYSASPAVGYLWKHLQQQQALVTDALQLETPAVDQSQAKRSA